MEDLKGEIINLEGINEQLKIKNQELESTSAKQLSHINALEENLLKTKQDLAESMNTIHDMELSNN